MGITQEQAAQLNNLFAQKDKAKLCKQKVNDASNFAFFRTLSQTGAVLSDATIATVKQAVIADIDAQISAIQTDINTIVNAS